MSPSYLIAGIILCFILAYYAWMRFKNQEPQPDTDGSRPKDVALPQTPIPNDKLILIKDIDLIDLEQIIIAFCNSYNKEGYVALPRLVKHAEHEFALFFTFNIDLDIFCFFINYLGYPIGYDRTFEVTGWATTMPSDMWITERNAHKRAIFYLHPEDETYDNVYMTTENQVAFKLDFGASKSKELLENPQKPYTLPPLDLATLQYSPFTDFK